MKILIISQNAYPSQSPRSYRTTELSEQLAKMGHDVVLYTVHGTCKYERYEKETGVTMRNIKHRLPLLGNDDLPHTNFIHRFLYHYFNRLLLYPDCEFYYIVDSIIQNEKNIDLLITIAFPYAIHFGATRSKRKHPNSFPKKWIADCGDPFSLNPLLNAPKYMEKYERQWCECVDYITVPTEESKKGYFPEYRDKIYVIPQGFNFSKTPIAPYEKNVVPTFLFAGTVYAGTRDPHSFMDYLLSFKRPYKFYMYMKTPLEKKYEIESHGQIEYVIGKNRKDVILEGSKMDFLINITNPTTVQTPSKLIDYGISKRPVLDITNEFVDDSAFNEFYSGNYSRQHVINSLEIFRIENVAKQFISLVKP